MKFTRKRDGGKQNEKRAAGAAGEAAAAKLLRRQGFIILHRNFTCPVGEIDFVARKRDLLVFAEVKSRAPSEFGSPEENVTPLKQKKIARAAAVYLRKFRLEHLNCRFDVFAVRHNERNRIVKITHFPDAFHPAGNALSP